MLDYRVDNPYGPRAGVQKKSWEDTLYALGTASYYAPTGADPDADLPGWHARIGQGEPYDGDPLLEHALDELTHHHSAYYIDDSVAPAPLFIYNSWTDDLFPGDEALRFWRKTRAHHPEAEIALQLADGFGHPRSSLASIASLTRLSQRVEDFFARHLKGANVPPPPAFETWTQGCNAAPELGPFVAPDWDAVHPGEVRFTDGASRSFTSGGGSQATANAVDPLGGGIFSSSCRTVPAADDPGAATYRFAPATGAGYTLMGAPPVIAHIDVSGRAHGCPRALRAGRGAGRGRRSRRQAGADQPAHLPAAHGQPAPGGLPAASDGLGFPARSRAEARAPGREPAVRPDGDGQLPH